MPHVAELKATAIGGAFCHVYIVDFPNLMSVTMFRPKHHQQDLAQDLDPRLSLAPTGMPLYQQVLWLTNTKLMVVDRSLR